MKIQPAHNNFTSEVISTKDDPYNSALSKTDGGILNKNLKNGFGLDMDAMNKQNLNGFENDNG